MNARTSLVAVGSGLLFGAGLAVSGLTRPEVVIGFLDVTGRWDPTLGVVMVVATDVNAALVALAMRRRRPLWAETLSLPAPGPIDRRLLAGAAVFGIGWGIVGVCPGPALTSLASGEASVLAFAAAMTADLVLTRIISTRTRDGRRTHHTEAPILARFFMLSVPVLLGSAVAVHAVTLTTPFLQGGSAVVCAVTNVGTQDATLTSVEMFSFEGIPIPADNYCGATLGPRRIRSVTVGGTMPSAFCQATGSGKLRVSILGYDGGVKVAIPGTAK
jgi:uncharacterized protein